MSKARKEGMSYIDKLNLRSKKNVPSTSLSGGRPIETQTQTMTTISGMKRKLHLAMALTGETKVNKYKAFEKAKGVFFLRDGFLNLTSSEVSCKSNSDTIIFCKLIIL